ncbi:hypothetical protein EPI10_000972 [Gossypium australe]|uniref:Uncharacterized protein n=1 Tax=Gossypium australe TaxID=47621 RepID=A0A5B6V9T0_9ROSI|nr:hypothetical protein EPI10_000972 [Gossypium australe]
MGQLANELQSRPQDALPSDTENPRSACKEHCKAITLRSERMLEPKFVEAEDKLVVPQNEEKDQLNVEIPFL